MSSSESPSSPSSPSSTPTSRTTTPPGSSTPPTTTPPDEPSSTDQPPTTTPPDDDTTTPPPNGNTTPTTTPPPTTTTEFTQTTTLPNGQVTQIITTVVILPGGQSTVTSIVTDGGDPNQSGGGGGGGGSDHTGTIVGATVGGVIAVAVVLLLWFVVARKRRDRAHKAFDGDIFNPDHTLRGPNFDLGGPPAPETIPVPYTFDDDPHVMREAGPPGVYPQQAYYAPSDVSNTTPGMAGLGAAGLVGAYAAQPHYNQTGYPTSDTASSSAGDRSSQPLMPLGAGRTSPASAVPLTGRAAKEREAFARTNAQRASMPPGAGPAYLGHPASTSGPPSAPSQYSSDGSHSHSHSASPHPYSPTRQSFAVANPDGPPLPNPYDQPVLVHQDAGRVPQSPAAPEPEPEEEREIPPTYDSIPLDEDARRRFSGPAAVPLPSSQHGHSESTS